MLTAGSSLAATPLYDAVLATVVPALDEIAREQAGEGGFVGMFIDKSSSDSSSYPTHGIKKSDFLVMRRDEEEVVVTEFNVTVAQDGDSLYLAASGPRARGEGHHGCV